ICDRVIFINGGRILLQETVENLETRFRATQLEVEFGRPIDPAGLRAVPGVRAVEAVSASRFRIAFDGDEGVRARILASCQQLGPVTSFGSAMPTLEGAYLRLIQGDGGSAPAPP
ncbi:ABC-type multidrug transport system, ATPase component, partial [mine drainage metagenome]